ncbi:hypothetical protein T459_23489, partial [Capsicum annuum]
MDCSIPSSTHRSLSCNSPLCSALGSRACAKCFNSHSPDDCSSNPCILTPSNSVTHKSSTGKAIVEALALAVTDGRNPGQVKGFSEFLLSCSKKCLLKGLMKGVAGLAGLGRSNFSLSTQFGTPSGTTSALHLFSHKSYLQICSRIKMETSTLVIKSTLRQALKSNPNISTFEKYSNPQITKKFISNTMFEKYATN